MIPMNTNHQSGENVTHADFSRIETATMSVHARLAACDVNAAIATTSWSRTAFPTPAQIDRIHQNISRMHAALCYLPDFRVLQAEYRTDGNRTLTAAALNNIEYDLQTIDAHAAASQQHYALREANTLNMQAGGILQ